jgi:ABC-type multidrug transport system permease subunit
MKLYYKIAVSTIYFTQNSHHKDIWKFMSILLLTINIVYNFLTIWLLFYFELFKGFTDFLAFDFKLGYYNGLFSFFIYLFLPILILNYILVFKKNKHLDLIERYSSSYNNKLFNIHFFLSWSIVFFVLVFVLRSIIK